MGAAFKAAIGAVIGLLVTGNTLLMKQSFSEAETPPLDEAAAARLVASEAKASALEQLRPDLAAAQAKIEQLTRSDTEKQSLLARIDSTTEDFVAVTGIGRIATAPDVMRFTVGVRAVRPSAKEATEAASSAAARVISALKDRGVKGRDMQTRWLSVGRHWNPNQPASYEASNSVEVKLRNLEEAGGSLSAAVEAGGEDAQLYGVDFYLEENSKAMIAVRKAAYESAKAKATEYAEMSSRKLGRVLIVQEGDTSPPPPIYSPSRSGGSSDASNYRAMPIEQGSTNQHVSVTLIFELI